LLVRTEDLAALYWIATGAVMLRTTMALVAKRSP
jgi:hypothetical protein